MIAKDPHPHSTKTLRQKQCLRNSWRCCWCYLRAKSGISGFIPSASASTSIPAGPREQNPGGSSSVSVAGTTLTRVKRPGKASSGGESPAVLIAISRAIAREIAIKADGAWPGGRKAGSGRRYRLGWGVAGLPAAPGEEGGDRYRGEQQGQVGDRQVEQAHGERAPGGGDDDGARAGAGQRAGAGVGADLGVQAVRREEEPAAEAKRGGAVDPPRVRHQGQGGRDH